MNEKKRKLSVALMSGAMAIILILSAITAYIGYKEFTRVLEQQYNDTAYEVAETALSYLNPDKFEQYLETGETDEEYDEILKKLDNLVVTGDCNFIYVSKIDSSDYLTSTYIYDSVNPSTGFSRYEFGYIYKDMDPKYYEDIKHILTTGGRAEKYLYSYSESGAHTTAGLAVKNSVGEIVAVIGVEKTMTVLETARNTYVKSVVVAAIFVCGITLLIVFLFLNGVLIKPMVEITNEAKRFAENSENPIEKLLAVNNKYEIGILASAIQKMEFDIQEYIDNLTTVTAEKERIGAELDVAKHIQASMLPCIFPAFPERHEFDIYATMTPAKEVGGDFYDFFLVDDNHLAMVMADVSGKGVPAALFMMISKTLLKSAAQTGLSPKAVLEKVNNQLCENNEAEMFVTVWLGILEISTGKMVCANAGHEYPAIKRKDGFFELFKDKHGFVLAGMEGARYKEYELELAKGDAIFVYTDGVAEATNAQEELYGTDRMINALNKQQNVSCERLLEIVHQDVDAFVAEAPQFDDITMLCLEFGERMEGKK